jgi:rhodanese-related sulfurtransferase
MSYETITAEQLQDILALPGIAVLDMRDARSYKLGHIEGAMQTDDGAVSAFLKERKRDRPVLVYCYHGNSSRDLAGFFSGLGYERVYNLAGGWQAWQNYCMRATTTLSDTLADWARTQGFDPGNCNSRIGNGMTMLMQAAWQGERDFVLELLGQESDPNLLNDDGNNALWFACVSEDPGIIAALIEHGVDINHQNSNGATALIYAASAGKLEAVKILVAEGADLACTTLDGFNAMDSASTLSILKFMKPYYVALSA